jgi:hypothetical protein
VPNTQPPLTLKRPRVQAEPTAPNEAPQQASTPATQDASKQEKLLTRSYRIPVSVAKALKHYAVDKGMTEQDVVTAALRALMGEGTGDD